jgi:hypothetical protein
MRAFLASHPIRCARKPGAAIPGGPLGGKTVHRTVFFLSASPLARIPAGRVNARPIQF